MDKEKRYSLEMISFGLLEEFIKKNKRNPDWRERGLLKAQAMNNLMCSIPVTDTDDKMQIYAKNKNKEVPREET